jgi:hypothetical protein
MGVAIGVGAGLAMGVATGVGAGLAMGVALGVGTGLRTGVATGVGMKLGNGGGVARVARRDVTGVDGSEGTPASSGGSGMGATGLGIGCRALGVRGLPPASILRGNGGWIAGLVGPASWYTRSQVRYQA